MSGTKVNLETLRAAIKDYQQVVLDLEAAYQSGTYMSYVVAPGKDTPGQVYNGSVIGVGAMHQQANKKLQEVLVTRIENLEATLRQYEQTEQGNQANLKPKD